MDSKARKPVMVILPEAPDWSTYLGELWQYAGLVWAFGVRDIKVKYAQSLLGTVWALIQPLTGLVIYTLFFHHLLGIDTPGVPYPLFLVCGIASWSYFSHVANAGGYSLMENQHLIRKMYFPRMVLPLSKLISGSIDLAAHFLFAVAVMIFYRHSPGWPLLYLPFFVLLNALTAFAFAVLLSAITVKNRDFHHLIPFLLGFGIWLTPVFFPVSLLPEVFKKLLFLNPMAWCAEGYRFCLAGGKAPEFTYVFSLIPLLIVLLAAFVLFRKAEQKMSEWL